MTRATLVDLDGTLVDTGSANHAAYAQALREAGVETTRARFDAVAAGRNWRQFLPGLLAEAGVAGDPAAIACRKAEVYPDHFHLIRVNTGLLLLLARLREQGPVALVTTASGLNARAILAHFGLLDRFDLVVTGDDVGRHKPDPEAYRLAAGRLGCAPGDCLVIEDSAIGIAAGRAFGAEVLVVAIG